MHDWQSLSHVRWECKYHVVIVPKYRKKKLYGKFRERGGQIIKDLCRQRGVEFIEWHLMPGHIHVCLSARQLGMCLLNRAKARGVRLIKGRVTDITTRGGQIETVHVSTDNGPLQISARTFVIAAGPYLKPDSYEPK